MSGEVNDNDHSLANPNEPLMWPPSTRGFPDAGPRDQRHDGVMAKFIATALNALTVSGGGQRLPSAGWN